MVEKASAFFLGEGKSSILAEFEHYTSLAITGLEVGNIESVAESMNACAKLLARAGVMTDRLSSMVSEARKFGCLAAKSTGAGGGGCVLALLDPGLWEEQLSKFRNLYSSDHVFEAFI
jgi:mevalonate kinase